MKKMVKSSDFIKTLKNTELFGNVVEILNEIERKKSEYEMSLGKVILSVEIDTDEDFSIEEKVLLGKYHNHIVVNEKETYHEALLRYIDGLKININKYNKNKVDRFIEMIRSKDIKDSLNHYGEISAGGNQTIDVYIVPLSNIMQFGDINIDLSE